jgi:hypothetical protein
MRRVLVLVLILAALGGVLWVGFRKQPPAPSSTSTSETAPATNGAPPTGGVTGSTTTPVRPVVVKSAATKSGGQTVVHGAWGSAPGEFARRRDPESNPEAPMAIAAAGRDVVVVDQVNRRVQRFHDGKLTATIPMGGDTVQDVAVAGSKTLLLDRLADKNVQVYGADGKLSNEVGIVGKGVPEGGGVTGVFADDDGIYVENQHASVIRIADASGNADPNRPELIGRPSRDGRYLLKAAIGDRASGTISVSAFDRQSGAPVWSQMVQVDEPILHIFTLDSDRHGRTYVAVDVGRESPAPPYQIVDEKIVIARLDQNGSPAGAIEAPPLGTADETFHPITVDDDGSILIMYARASGLDVVRFSF